MADGYSELRDALVGHRAQIEDLAAETFALQCLVTFLLSEVGSSRPDIRPLIGRAFEKATRHVEDFCISSGPAAAHLPKAIHVIEQMRLALEGKGEPKHGV